MPHYVPASYKNLRLRGRLARWALFLVVLAWIAGVALLGWEIHLINEAKVGHATHEDFVTAIHRENTLFAIKIILLVVTFVVFVLWFYRAYRNLDALGGERRYRAGWAFWSWVVPPLQVFLPPLIAVDMWRGSDPHIKRETAVGHGVVWWWWSTGAVALAVGMKAQSVIHSAVTIDDVEFAAKLWFVSAALLVVSGMLAMRMVGDITQREEDRARVIGKAAVRAQLTR